MSTLVTSVKQFDQLLEKYPKVAIDFKAVWCGPCKLISPAFEGHAKAQKEALKADSTKADDIVFITIDVDDVPEIAEKYGITAMPTFKFLVNGKEVDELIGANKGSLEIKVKGLLGVKTQTAAPAPAAADQSKTEENKAAPAA
ncbi:glycerol ether metabolic process [Coemansia interrupta]|uniref:Glycerol ether metabolic process n=1 Tax=Coemansia interrupta TaxID=1126814 RepID=A0A9W8HGL5_9FUNG|nr:glycerol ether metabolic process [Coemansia interrupta]